MSEDQTVVVEVRGPQGSGATTVAEILVSILEGVVDLDVSYDPVGSGRTYARMCRDLLETGSVVRVQEAADDLQLHRDHVARLRELVALQRSHADLEGQLRVAKAAEVTALETAVALTRTLRAAVERMLEAERALDVLVRGGAAR